MRDKVWNKIKNAWVIAKLIRHVILPIIILMHGRLICTHTISHCELSISWGCSQANNVDDICYLPFSISIRHFPFYITHEIAKCHKVTTAVLFSKFTVPRSSLHIAMNSMHQRREGHMHGRYRRRGPERLGAIIIVPQHRHDDGEEHGHGRPEHQHEAKSRATPR